MATSVAPTHHAAGTSAPARRAWGVVATIAAAGLAAGLLTAAQPFGWDPTVPSLGLPVHEVFGGGDALSVDAGLYFGLLVAAALVLTHAARLPAALVFVVVSITAWIVAMDVVVDRLHPLEDSEIARAGYAAGAAGSLVLAAGAALLWRRWSVLGAVIPGPLIGGLLVLNDSGYVFFGTWQGLVALALGWGLVQPPLFPQADAAQTSHGA